MLGKFNFREAAGRLTERLGKDPRVTVRAVLGLLVLANLVAAGMVFKPLGGSPEDLQRRLVQLGAEVQQRQASLDRLHNLVQTVEKTRSQADQFFSEYFLDSRTAASAIVSELTTLAKEAGIKDKEHSFAAEPVEGSDTLEMMNIEGHYEGTYANLIHFVNLVDRSPRFLTIESLQATPQQSQGLLNISLKLNVFVRGAGQDQ
jgi:Tfp pilus assembly protein PilO